MWPRTSQATSVPSDIAFLPISHAIWCSKPISHAMWRIKADSDLSSGGCRRRCQPHRDGLPGRRTIGVVSATPNRIDSAPPDPAPRATIRCLLPSRSWTSNSAIMIPRPDCLHLSHGSSSSFRVRVPGIRVTGSLRLPRSRCHGLFQVTFSSCCQCPARGSGVRSSSCQSRCPGVLVPGDVRYRSRRGDLTASCPTRMSPGESTNHSST